SRPRSKSPSSSLTTARSLPTASALPANANQPAPTPLIESVPITTLRDCLF
ncbi:MAG: Mobile element protein, partial [Olavius algarvensis Gamma 1 endosymbiont]